VNQCYSRFLEKALGDQGSLGQFFAEWKDSLGMINRRTVQLLTAAKSLKKGNLLAFADDLGLHPTSVKRKHRNKPNHEIADGASSLWLEYWFGWAPFVNDITSLASLMGQPFPGSRVRASAMSRDTVMNSNQNFERNIRHAMGGTVRISNPNEFLLNQLGLTDYLGTAWARVPFSFLADWCFDTQRYLSSFQDWAGVDVSDTYTNHYLRFHDRIQATPGFEYFPGWAECKGSSLIRKTGLAYPVPNLQITANLKQSLTRTASSVSLLAQMLLRM
jgi:hypothetical protein